MPLPDDGIFAATTPRRELDAALVDLAIEAGATVLQGHALTGVREMPASIVVDVDGDASARSRLDT